MNKLKLKGQNLGQVFNSSLESVCIYCAIAFITKWPNLKLKTWPKPLFGSLLFAFVLPTLDLGYIFNKGQAS